MSVLISRDNKELIATCDCKCGESVHIILEDFGEDFAFMSFMSNNWYKEQERPLRSKASKIWRILRGKDYYYSEIVMTKDDWNQFKAWVNSQDVPE